LHKLDDEISRLIKLIGETLLREATPEDLAAALDSSTAEGVGRDDRSESARLRKLPGFSRLQRQLWVNLMSAQPDASSRNVRIPTEQARQDTALHGPDGKPQGGLLGMLGQHGHGHGSMAGHSSSSADSGGAPVGVMYDKDFSLDRGTAKEISKMVVERDKGKSKTNNVAGGNSISSYNKRY
jgi:hypothetical protein